jgi:membrane protein
VSVSSASTVADARPSRIRAAINFSERPWLVVETAIGRFLDNDDLLWASALTYTTALSIVPLLVLVFSILKGLGYTDQLEPVITSYVGSPDIADQLLGFVHNMKVTTLGSVGAATLIITDISLLGTIENAFNHSWGVAKGRSYLRKFTDYLSVTFTVPVLLVTAMTLTAGVTNSAAFLKGLGFAGSFALVWAGYFVLFVFFPNTKVRWRPALIGSLITAVLWTLAQWAYIHFQYGVSSYRAYYGALAAIPVFLVWIYFSWAIVLLGVEFAVVLQRGPYRPLKEAIPPGFTRRAVLLTLMRIGERMTGGSEPVTVGTIAHELGVSEEQVTPVIERLEETGILAEVEARIAAKPSHELLLTRSPELLLISDALEYATKSSHPMEARVERMISKIEDVEKAALRGATVLDLIADARKNLIDTPDARDRSVAPGRTDRSAS